MARRRKHLDDRAETQIADLVRRNNELNNVLSVALVPFLILNTDHRIRRLTPDAAKLLQLPQDALGQRVDEVRVGAEVPDLRELISPVIEHGLSLQREVRARGRWYSMRVGPCRTADGMIDGALVAFVDIQELKAAVDFAITPDNGVEAPGQTLRQSRQVKVVLLATHPGATHRESITAKLTTRQREVLRLLAEGLPVKEIATALNVSPRTVEFHKYRIMETLGAHSGAQLARYAMKEGLVS